MMPLEMSAHFTTALVLAGFFSLVILGLISAGAIIASEKSPPVLILNIIKYLCFAASAGVVLSLLYPIAVFTHYQFSHVRF